MNHNPLKSLNSFSVRHSGDDVNLEIDLWYRGDAIQRENADLAFRSVLAEIDGVVLDELRIDEIRYHSVLVKIPGSELDAIIDLTGPMVIADEIMSIRPQGIFKFNVDEPDIEVCRTETNLIEDPGRKSIGALIDGWPVENHTLLQNRLDVIPLDVGASLAPTQTRYHGTAMASLILRGDAHSESSPISRRLKVVPVLAADSAGYESTPSDKLPLGLIHHAVKELKEGLNGQPPSGPDVVIINHSICDEAFGFSGTVSPWARLLDYLSWKYKILFVVSAGNICEYFDVPEYQNAIELRAAAPDARKEAMLCALAAAKSKRTMFAPAESVNALTVAAAHSDDSSEQLPPNLADPFVSFPTANLCSGLGLGFNQSIKPDVMFPGGRQIAHPTTMNGLMVQGREAPNFFGQKVASPDPYSGDLNMVRRSSGTSNAAALTTRAGLLIADVLDESPLSGSDGLAWDARSTAPCVLKALIAHGATWGSVGETMASVYGASLSKNRAKEMVSRVIGYGCVDPGRIISENSRRVTLLGQDIIKKDQRHQWRIPLPYELSSVAEFRRLVVTLAWLTPIKANSSNYRMIGLELVGDDGLSAVWDGADRVSCQPSFYSSQRGTLIHSIYEGKKAIPFDENGNFVLNVQAVSRLTRVLKYDIPYALAVTIEVSDNINADIRDTIRRRINAQVRS